jgi:hypothetical protein
MGQPGALTISCTSTQLPEGMLPAPLNPTCRKWSCPQAASATTASVTWLVTRVPAGRMPAQLMVTVSGPATSWVNQ